MNDSLLTSLRDELQLLLSPLLAAVDDVGARGRLLAALGADASLVSDDALLAALTAVGDLRRQIDQVASAPAPSFGGITALLQASGNLFAAARALGQTGNVALVRFGADLIALLTGAYVRAEHPLLYDFAVLLTLIDSDDALPAAPGAGELARRPLTLARIRFDRLAALVHDPGGMLRVEYLPNDLATVADANATGDKLFPLLGAILTGLGFSWSYGILEQDRAILGDAASLTDHALQVGMPAALVGDDLDAGLAFTLSSAERGDLGLVISPFGALDVSKRVGRWQFEVSLTADVQALAIGRHGPTVLASAGTTDIEGRVSATLVPQNDGGGPAYVFGSPTGTRLELSEATFAASIDVSGDRSTIALATGVPSSALVVAAGDGDSFLQSILPSDGLRATFDLGITYSNKSGLSVRGGTGLDATLPVELSLAGTVTLLAIHVGVTVDDADVTADVSAIASLDIGPVRIVVDRIGIATRLAFPPNGGNLGLVDLRVGFKPPTGLGLSIDAAVVSGGGFLLCEPDLGRYTGALHIKIADTIDIAAWGVLQTGSATQHWSLVVILAGHISPIELGWGFRLTGLGGLLALHRRMDTDALRDAAYGVRGSLDDLLFPDNPETRLPQLLSTVERFFPAATNSYVAGPMAEIEWGPKAEVNARIRLAILLQLDAEKVALYGTVRIGFPTLDNDSTLRIRAGIEALVDPRDQMARFSITLIEAKLFGTIQFTGGAAFFVRWGLGREFAFTIGGFHPAFRPYIPEGLIEPPRIGVHWNPIAGVRLDLTQYFAITSTSMQFGASAHAEVGCSWGKVTGDLAFDLLVMTSPSLHLEADLHARVTVSVFGADILSAGLDGSLVGPGPWVFAGKVTWKVWIFGISKSFHFDWGDRASIPAVPQSAGQILGAEMQSAGNWTSFRTRVLPVKLRSGVSAPLAPRDEVEVRQSRLPFGTRIETMENNPLSDAGVWTLTTTSVGSITKLADLTEVFPERRFLAQPSKERPFRGGLTCGARLGRADWDISTVAIAVDSTATDDIVVDSGATVAGAVTLPTPAAADAVAIALPTTAPARAFTRGAPTLEVVQ